jgi:hypothetical protein
MQPLFLSNRALENDNKIFRPEVFSRQNSDDGCPTNDETQPFSYLTIAVLSNIAKKTILH